MKTIAFLTLMIITSTGFGQILNLKKDQYWASASFGNFISQNTDGFTYGISANAYRDSVLYRLRMLKNEEFSLSNKSPSEDSYSFAVLLGKIANSKYAQLQFSCGLGVISGTKRGKFLYSNPGFVFGDEHYESNKYITPTIPLECEIILKPIKYFGLGLTFYGDVNFISPNYGLLLNVSLGKLR